MPKELPPLSDEFIQAFCDAGTPVAVCGFCGKRHICTGECSRLGYEEADLALYRSQGAIEHNYDGLTVGEMAGTLLVADCDCEKARRYEAFVWEHRQQIIRYLQARSQREAAEAARTVGDLAALVGGDS